ncbi:hypothetical protein GCM10010872_03660 [Dyella flava]|nr:hypothetical protein GCM10010872_03660 [Dyella flava]
MPVPGASASTVSAPICNTIKPSSVIPSGRADNTLPIRQPSELAPAAAPSQVSAATLVGWMITLGSSASDVLSSHVLANLGD